MMILPLLTVVSTMTLNCQKFVQNALSDHYNIAESLFLLRRRLGHWPRSKHKKRPAGSVRETWTFAAADGVRCARVS